MDERIVGCQVCLYYSDLHAFGDFLSAVLRVSGQL